jgi:hypothetical protein
LFEVDNTELLKEELAKLELIELVTIAGKEYPIKYEEVLA